MCRNEDTLYLAGRKVKGRGFHSGYEKLLPERLTKEQLLVLIQRLRNGDTTVIDDVIMQHLALTISIVARYVAYLPKKSDDLMGVGALALTEAVRNFVVVSKDDNLGGYITSTLHGKLARFVQEEDHTIQVSTRGFEKAVAKAKKTGMTVAQCLPHTVSFNGTDSGDTDEASGWAAKTQTKMQENVCNVSTVDDTTTSEVQEILQKLCFTRFEMLVYDRLIQGMKESQIARELKYCKQRINQIKRDVMEKLKPYYGDKFNE